jgi:TetR/AcrR family transcriptional regulator, mexJK operon transcriptional repressor
MATKAVIEGKPARKRGRPPSHAGSSEARQQAILDAARDIFLERGYTESSVDAVIERVGGSKATIYSLFGSKEGLLSAVAAKCGSEFTAAVEKVDVSSSPAESLRRIARVYCKAMFHPKRLAMYRMAVGESGRRPESGDNYYRLGPRATLGVAVRFFRECANKGVIETSDPDLLADGFLAALRGSLFNRAVLNPTRVPTQQEIDYYIDFIVDTFLRGVHPTTANGPSERP